MNVRERERKYINCPKLLFVTVIIIVVIYSFLNCNLIRESERERDKGGRFGER